MVQNPWRITSTQTTQVDRFKITLEEVILSNQKTKNFSYIHFRDGVCILPITSNGEIIVLRQYRHALKAWELELPAGMIDGNELPIDAAKRELLEETGYQSNKWEELDYFYPSPGSTTETIHLFLAENAKYQLPPQLDELEKIEVMFLDLKEFQRLVEYGQFRHGAGLACWAKYLNKQPDINN
ncbi:NUDIX hydrolase [Gracilibacillus sp. YIM 98692]|uniref:NUDIX hydrolase n=1 Tax=Gracilibacillus sp. YIM 98692 TaxID=2663532 RepID=UPI0013D51EEF|nr:NUDIX hydrolase [Gracilibacillus sp. YIM 98692]